MVKCIFSFPHLLFSENITVSRYLDTPPRSSDYRSFHALFMTEGREKPYFFLKSVAKNPPIKYVRCVTRFFPLKDWEVKMLLMTEFFHETERALHIGSSWLWSTSAKGILRTLQGVFPDEHFVSDTYLLQIESRVKAAEERKQQLVLDRAEYSDAVRRAVFPRLALPPKI